MLKKVKVISSAILSSAVLLVSNAALAVSIDQNTVNAANGGGGFKSDLGSTINLALSYVLGIAGLIALFYIIFGGFSYLTSSGDSEKVGKATKMMTYAVIGVVIIALAFAIKQFLLGTVFGINQGTNINL